MLRSFYGVSLILAAVLLVAAPSLADDDRKGMTIDIENEDGENISITVSSNMVDGIIKGNRLTLESSLAEYLIALKNSPLFDQPTINKKSIEQLNNQTVIRFTAQLDLV